MLLKKIFDMRENERRREIFSRIKSDNFGKFFVQSIFKNDKIVKSFETEEESREEFFGRQKRRI